MFDPARTYEDHYSRDATTGVVYDRVRGDPARYDGAVQIDGAWCLPNRRHLTPPALRRELETARFRVLWQGGTLGGDVVCTRADDDAQPVAATFRRIGQIEERLP
jgi:hypothetical protein